MSTKQVFYRAEMGYFYTGRLSTPKIVIDVDEYFELSRTPCGVWLDCSPRKPRWINLSAQNRFAHDSRRQALKAFVRRKRYRNHCIEQEMERNTIALRMVQDELKDDKQRKVPLAERGVTRVSKGTLRKSYTSSQDW